MLPSWMTRKKNETQRSTLFVSAKLLVANACLTSECKDYFLENLAHDSYSRIEKYQKTESRVTAANKLVFWYVARSQNRTKHFPRFNCICFINILLRFSFRVVVVSKFISHKWGYEKLENGLKRLLRAQEERATYFAHHMPILEQNCFAKIDW